MNPVKRIKELTGANTGANNDPEKTAAFCLGILVEGMFRRMEKSWQKVELHRDIHEKPKNGWMYIYARVCARILHDITDYESDVFVYMGKLILASNPNDTMPASDIRRYFIMLGRGVYDEIILGEKT